MSKAEQQKATLMSEATQHISILMNAVNLERATDEEKLQLKVWRKHPVFLNRIDNSSPSILWPEKQKKGRPDCLPELSILSEI